MKNTKVLITQNSLLKTNAVAALPTILLIGGIIVEIGVAGAFVSYLLSQSGFGAKLSAEAFAAAQSGIDDAMLKIVRDKNFYTGPAAPYTLTVGNRSAQVIVCKDLKTVSSACGTSNIGKDEITSLGSALTKRRQLRAIVNVDDNTGEVKVESIQEIAL